MTSGIINKIVREEKAIQRRETIISAGYTVAFFIVIFAGAVLIMTLPWR